MSVPKNWLKIGEVARLCGVSTDTLRYYSRIGLFREDYVSQSGYRYYNPDRLNILDMILWLRANRIPLCGIAEIVNSGSMDTARAYFELQKTKIEEQIQQLEGELKICQYFLNEFSQQQRKLGQCCLKQFDTRYCTTNQVPLSSLSYEDYTAMLNQIKKKYVNKQSYCNSLWGGVFPRRPAGGYESDMYAAIYNITEGTYPMPAGTYAVLPLFGFFDTARNQIGQLSHFIREQGLTPDGNCYAVTIWEGTVQDSRHKLIELQIHIRPSA